MPLFEVEGKSKIDADHFITTSETIVKTTDPRSQTEIKAKNFVAGNVAKDFIANRETSEKGWAHKIKDYALNHSIGFVFTVGGAILAAALITVFGIK